MSLKTLTQVVTRFGGRALLKARGASPTILVAGGVASLVAAGVVAVKNSPKMEAVTDRLEDDLEIAKQLDPGRFSEDDKQKARFVSYLEFLKGFVRVYGPSLLLASAGIVAIASGHGIMIKRQRALAAAYGALATAYSAYRERVVESLGSEFDEAFAKNQNVVYKDDKIVGKAALDADGNIKPSVNPYVFNFGPENRHWNYSQPEWNLTFLRAQERYANQLLIARGHVFLHEILTGLGIEPTKASAITGWTYNGNGDNFIDFDLPEINSAEEQDWLYFFRNGDDASIPLEFNVDGPIWQLLPGV